MMNTVYTNFTYKNTYRNHPRIGGRTYRVSIIDWIQYDFKYPDTPQFQMVKRIQDYVNDHIIDSEWLTIEVRDYIEKMV